MSIEAMARVIDHSQATGMTRLILLLIANYETEDRGAFPSVDRLATAAHCSERAVQDAIGRAKRAGELAVSYRQGPNGTNLYRTLCGLRGAAPLPLGEAPTSAGVQNLRGADDRRESAPELKEQGSETSSPHVVDIERPDVEGLCSLLAELIEANGVKRPSVTATWRREMRLLIDRDGYAPEVIERVIRFTQADEFEKANVLGVPKLRKRFGSLKIKAERGAHPAGGNGRWDWPEMA